MRPISPFEWIATLLWDRHGTKRAAQRVRLMRGARKLREFDEVNERAMEQIRRTQEIGATMADRF